MGAVAPRRKEEEEGPAQGQEDRAQMAGGEEEVYGFGVRKGRGTEEE